MLLLSAPEEEELKLTNQINKLKQEKEKEERKVFQYKYEANGLKQCKDNANLMGQKQVKTSAEQQFIITHWQHELDAIAKAGGHMTLGILNKFHSNGEDIEEGARLAKEEVSQYQLLHTYIEKYQEKLGLFGTKSKKSEVEKVLAFTHKDIVKKANEVYIDFESFKKAKMSLQEKSSVKSQLRENCI